MPLGLPRAGILTLCMGAVLLLPSCRTSVEGAGAAGVPVAVSVPGRQDVDLDVIYAAVEPVVRSVLPDARFNALVFFGTCRDLPLLRGRVVLIFEQKRVVWLRPEVLLGSASVDTIQHTMDVSYEDLSDVSTTLESHEFVGNADMKRVASLASGHISDLGLRDCQVTMTQISEPPSPRWDVQCTSVTDAARPCHFAVTSAGINDIAP
jgi:hypothetical protein